MNRKLPAFPAVFTVLVILASIADYIDHISRPDGRFLAIWPQWALFTALSTAFLLIVYLVVERLLSRFAKMPAMLGGALALGLAIFAHVTINGDLAARIAGVDSNLTFDQPLIPVLVAMAVYLVLAMLYAGLRRALKK
ncbi:hypothetical protein [Sphingomicrobium sediminis]|uniref:Uncharacterized protein n=1 Tax=Sphingomicrobium sediminis TaxID=2950949 RepID=A0A9X2EJG3_9SPHN|nr:hypothetical protein [Sphingomicrobium sediminis]MCM8556469.1 hypothetical protein [Sphingomicrobium sediminis]